MERLYRSLEKVLPSLSSTSDGGGQSQPPPLSPHPTLQALAGQASNTMSNMISKASSSFKHTIQAGRHADDETQDGVPMMHTIARSSGGGGEANTRDDAQRLARFNIELKASCINLHSLKRLAVGGIPQDLRITVFKLLLGYLPPR